jgi:hypothetical protein
MIVAESSARGFSIFPHAPNTSLLVVYGCTIESDSSGGELQEGEWRSLAAIPHKSLKWRGCLVAPILYAATDLRSSLTTASLISSSRILAASSSVVI